MGKISIDPLNLKLNVLFFRLTDLNSVVLEKKVLADKAAQKNGTCLNKERMLFPYHNLYGLRVDKVIVLSLHGKVFVGAGLQGWLL